MTETSREFLVHSDATIAVSAVLVCTPVGLDAPRESETQASIGVGSGDCGSQFHWHDRINCKVGAVTDCRRKLRHVLSLQHHRRFPRRDASRAQGIGRRRCVWRRSVSFPSHADVYGAAPTCDFRRAGPHHFRKSRGPADVKARTGPHHMMAEDS